MATTTSTSGITSLDSTYTSLINYQIQLESKPLTTLQSQQSALKLQRAVYNDLKTKLSALRTATKSLMSTDTFYSLKPGRTVSITNVATGTSVLSAAASSLAVAASYDIANISLALTDRVRSDEQEYADQALSKSGTFTIGGSAERSAERNLQAVNSFGTAAIDPESTKLADGTYFIETQQNQSGTWEFRLLNSTGTAQEINGSGSNGWQSIPVGGGVYNSGRGLTIDFGTDAEKYVASSKSAGSAANVNFSSVDESFVLSDVKNTALTSMETVANIEKSSTIAAGQQELGNGTYFVETKQSTEGIWQFRLVDSEGTAAKIASVNGGSYTSSWQTIPTSGETYSTGRGVELDFGTDPSKFVAKSKLSGAASVEYQSKGAEITVTESMSLNDIASEINKGTFGSGNEVIATVVNKQLVLSNKYTGASHRLQASGQVLQDLGILTESGFKNVMQTAKDATFTVNGLNITRSQNSGLTDVISGVTLYLASDAEGKSATLNINADNTAQKNAITNFITNFNSLQSYLSSKIAVTKQTDGTYVRGSLSGDQSVIGLRNSLYSLFNKTDSTAILYKSMRDIGITMNSSMTVSITDSAKLDSALKTNYAEVVSLMDRVMSSLDTKLEKYSSTGTGSYIDQMIKANEAKTKYNDMQIKTFTTRIEQRRITLTNQYTDAQGQMNLLENTQSMNSAWITSLYSNMFK